MIANARVLAAGLALGAMAFVPPLARAAPNAVVDWNQAALQEVRSGRLSPPVVSRALAIAHTCMYDAWSAYDVRAIAVAATAPRRPGAEFTDANKTKAVSYAAYRCLSNLFPAGVPRLNAVMAAKGYDINDNSIDLALPQGIGNAAAAAVIASRRFDGSNQYGDLATGAYADYSGYASRNGPMPFCLPTTVGFCPLNISDPLHWQPLTNDKGVTQKFAAPFWEQVKPFALSSATQFDTLPSVAPGPNYLRSAALLESDISQMIGISGTLTAQQKLIVEYWADGPDSELPPGHWGLFAQAVSIRDNNTIDKDAKMFFAMHNASFDSGIVAWHLKRKYDGVRPITAARNARQGQSIFAWGGPNQPNQFIDGGKWTPYNPGSNLTPTFPGYISGHSTFSAASAAVLRAFTGSDNFGFTTVIPANFGRVEHGIPAVPTALSYPTFTAAVSEAGQSRLYAGIHFSDDNTTGQDVGYRVGAQAYARAQFLFDGGLAVGAAGPTLASSAKSDFLAWSHTVDALGNRLLVVGVASTGGNNNVDSVTFGGLPLTRLGRQNGPSNKQLAELWYRIAPPVGTATVEVELSQAKGVVAGATTYVGVHQQAPFGILRGASAKSDVACVWLANEPAPLVTTVQTVKGDSGGTLPGNGQLLRWLGVSNKTGDLNDKYGSKEVIGKGATYKSAPMGSVCSPLNSTAEWAALAVPLKPAQP